MADSAVKIAKDNMFVDTAVGTYLRRLGSNYGVPSPIAAPFDDVLYRQFVQLLAAQPKAQRRIVIQMLEILFGSQASIIALGRRPWRVFEVRRNTLTVEIPTDCVPSIVPTNASHLHGLGGHDGWTDASPTELFVYRDDDFTKAAVPLAGLPLFINGVQYTIVSVTYNATTKLNTFNLLEVPPASLASADWYVPIPSSFSFPGSYFTPNALVSSDTVGGNPVILYGPGLVEIFKQYMLQLVKAAGVQLDIQMVLPGYVHPTTPPVSLVSIAVTP